jgi:hypothetical protein
LSFADLNLFNSLEVNSEFDGIDSWSGSQIIHSSLEPAFPSIKMHGGDFGVIRLRHENIQRLRLVYKRRPSSSQVDDLPLRELPDSSESALDMIRNLLNVLNGSIVSQEFVLKLLVPDSQIEKLFNQMSINTDEFT